MNLRNDIHFTQMLGLLLGFVILSVRALGTDKEGSSDLFWLAMGWDGMNGIV